MLQPTSFLHKHVRDVELAAAHEDAGIGLVSFLAALCSATAVFSIQVLMFLLLRKRVKKIFEPKTYLVPQKERVKPPPTAFFSLLQKLWKHKDYDIIMKCGLDAYFFLRYLKTMLVIFLPIFAIVTPTLATLNYVDGRGQDINENADNTTNLSTVTGLDVLAWGNISTTNTKRYSVHLVMAIITILWVCIVFFLELRAYIKIRQDYLTSAQHRLRASATTVLVSSIPNKWLSENALSGLFDVYPGGVKNITLNRDYSKLLLKIRDRYEIHLQLEYAQTRLIQAATKAHFSKLRGTTYRTTTRDPHPLRLRSLDLAQARKIVHVAKSTITGTLHEVNDAMDANRFQKSNVLIPHEGVRRNNLPTVNPSNQRSDSSNEVYECRRVNWWEFWRTPFGSYIAAVPQNKTHNRDIAGKGFFNKAMSLNRSTHCKTIQYPPFQNTNFEQRPVGECIWKRFLSDGHRPKHRLPAFGVRWLPRLPIISNKVDTILWCRMELARLNSEIEDDQSHPERFPLMNSAFVQFNRQVAAQMACQCEAHHIPKYMAPRITEVSPRDVIWANMALNWWGEWARTLLVFCILLLLQSICAIPVAWTGVISQLHEVIKTNTWIAPAAENIYIENFARVAAGVAPSIILAILLHIVPVVLNSLAKLKGVKTKGCQTKFVQTFFFIFLFIQIFFIGSLSSFLALSMEELTRITTELRNISDILNLLAMNVPKAANFFFSYMILQALSTSSSTLLQVGPLVLWFMGRLLDTTARQKWIRQTKLPEVHWGICFPIYTNFACIALIYCIIAPLICCFAVITFSLLWIAQRYIIMYVVRFQSDTGGILYPRAINQTFAGLYMMEICVASLFLIVEDEGGHKPCTAHGIIMLLCFMATILYQVLVNKSLSPLFNHLPVILEDEAVRRDQAFRFKEDETGYCHAKETESIGCDHSSDWGHDMQHALYGGIAENLEDLEPEEISILTSYAFTHEAIRARAPVVWIPNDETGVSNDEIRHTTDYSDHIHISNDTASLCSKGRVLFHSRPPDFSELDVINM